MRIETRRLEAAGLTEEQILDVLDDMQLAPTYLKVRRAMLHPTEKLSQGCREEIYYGDQSRTLQDEAVRYRTTEQIVANARILRRKSREKTLPTEVELRSMLPLSGSARQLAKDIGCTLAHVYDTLGLRRSSTQEPAVLRLLATGMTHEYIAHHLDMPRATVTAINGRHNVTRKNKKHSDWPSILKAAEDTSVAEAARQYGVTRANIYYHRKKTCSDAK